MIKGRTEGKKALDYSLSPLVIFGPMEYKSLCMGHPNVESVSERNLKQSIYLFKLKELGFMEENLLCRTCVQNFSPETA